LRTASPRSLFDRGLLLLPLVLQSSRSRLSLFDVGDSIPSPPLPTPLTPECTPALHLKDSSPRAHQANSLRLPLPILPQGNFPILRPFFLSWRFNYLFAAVGHGCRWCVASSSHRSLKFLPLIPVSVGDFRLLRTNLRIPAFPPSPTPVLSRPTPTEQFPVRSFPLLITLPFP